LLLHALVGSRADCVSCTKFLLLVLQSLVSSPAEGGFLLLLLLLLYLEMREYHEIFKILVFSPFSTFHVLDFRNMQFGAKLITFQQDMRLPKKKNSI